MKKEPKIKALIVDDEQPSIDTLNWKLNQYCPQVEVVDSFTDPRKAVEFLRSQDIDLLFLDIKMPMLSGFDVVAELNNKDIKVIFITAHDQFGIQAIKADATDYLLKPVQNTELQKAIARYLQRKGNEANKQIHADTIGDTSGAKIMLATKERIQFVEPDEIVYCEASSNYCMVYLTENRKELISKTLKDIESSLFPKPTFIRTHQSFLINKKYVKALIRQDGGYLEMKNGVKIPISRHRREEVLEQLQKS